MHVTTEYTGIPFNISMYHIPANKLIKQTKRKKFQVKNSWNVINFPIFQMFIANKKRTTKMYHVYISARRALCHTSRHRQTDQLRHLPALCYLNYKWLSVCSKAYDLLFGNKTYQRPTHAIFENNKKVLSVLSCNTWSY
jgi:hypothetical protein